MPLICRFRKALAMFAAVAGLAAAAWVFGLPAPLADRLHPAPRLAVADTVDAGPAEAGGLVTAEFPLANTGRRPLEVSDIRTGCACIGLEQKTDAGYQAVNRLTVPPGEQVQLALRFHATGVPGQQMRVGVRFQTNDPQTPEASPVVVTRVRGGLVVRPSPVILDPLVVGSPRVVRLDVFDTAEQPQHVRAASLTGLPHANCRFVPQPEAATGELGACRGHIEISITPTAPGPLSGQLVVTHDDPTSGPIMVSVSGTAVKPVRLAPSQVRLPVRNGDDTQYSTQCLYRSSVGNEPVELTLRSAPAGISVVITPEADRLVGRLTVHAAESVRQTAAVHQVRLTARVGGQTVDLELPVAIEPPQ